MIMGLAACADCGRIYARQYGNLCPECVKRSEVEFELVKEYLGDHEDANAKEVAEALDIPVNRIARLLREGRLIARGGPGLACEGCGKPIADGRLCPECQTRLRSSMSRLAGELRASARPGTGNPPKQGSSYHSRRDD